MEKIHKKQTITTYRCDNCKEEHTDISEIRKCEFCGKEICSSCGIDVNDLDTEDSFHNILYGEDIYSVCCSCRDNLLKKIEEIKLDLIDWIQKNKKG